MGIISRALFIGTFLSGAVFGSPMLRLSTTAMAPIIIATGQNGPTQSITASNAGDGNLSLTATANVSWLSASVASNVVRIALNTSSLAAGMYTGLVTVSDPNAVDAPQTITVTVQMGSGIPNSMDLYLKPGGSATGSFIAPISTLSTVVNNPAGGPTLSVATLGGGSFDFSFSYQVTSSAAAGLGEGDYPGSFTVSGSPFAGDNKTVQVTSHVTSQPIANWTSIKPFRIAQGAAPQTQVVVFNNPGLGTLTIGNISGNPSWLTTSVQGLYLSLTADPTGMGPGMYQATITVASNAKNSPASIPVELDVLPTGPAFTYYQGVLDNAIFGVGDSVAPGGIIALFGEQLTAGPIKGASQLPLGTSLGGATVFVNNQPAPIYYVSPGQIDFMIPYATSQGTAVVRVDRDGQTGNSVSLGIVPVAPRLLPLGIDGYGIAVLSDLVTFAIPTTAGIPSRPAKAGSDVVVFYALGLGQTSPPAVDGQAASATQVNPLPKVVIGESFFPGTGVTVDPQYAGLTPGLVGLYQINAAIPASALKGNAVPVYISQNGIVSNKVNIAIQ